MKKILITVASVTMLLALLSPTTALAAPSEAWVDDDFDSSTTGWGETHFDTIQNGIDAVGTGGTVHVAAGNYNENITLKKDILVKGEDATSTTINGTGSGPVVTAANIGSGETLEGFTIKNGNTEQGGGVYILNCSPVIRNCIITGNTAKYGGGIFINTSSSPTIINAVIYANSATSLGGGILVAAGSSPTIMNGTITENSAGTGGGIYNNGSSTTITNSIVYENTSTGSGPNILVSSGTVTATYSDIEGGGYAGSNDNIDADPMFVDSGAGDFHLQATSPCIDAGTNNGAPDHDIEGNPRPFGGDVDMGAYEYVVSYTITATAGADGTISPSGYVTVNHGDNQTFTITPAPGYHIDDVLVDDVSVDYVSVGDVGYYTFISVEANYAIHATFAVDNTDTTGPPGWDRESKEGWNGSVPPGLEKQDETPPGFDKGNKTGWEKANTYGYGWGNSNIYAYGWKGGQVPPGLEKQDKTPPGSDKGNKTGWK